MGTLSAEEAAALLVEKIQAASEKGPPRIVIDGPSGAGKTSFAQGVVEQLARLGVDALHLNVEEWTPGWHGLAAARPTTEALLAGDQDSYRRWDWTRGHWADPVAVEAKKPWVLEGCGALTATTAALADLTVWVETDPETAKRRGLERDGAAYAPFWQIWNEQEQRHWAHEPWAWADVVVET